MIDRIFPSYVRSKRTLVFLVIVEPYRNRYGFAIEFRGHVFLRDTQIDRRWRGVVYKIAIDAPFRVTFLCMAQYVSSR